MTALYLLQKFDFIIYSSQYKLFQNSINATIFVFFFCKSTLKITCYYFNKKNWAFIDFIKTSNIIKNIPTSRTVKGLGVIALSEIKCS